MADESCLTWWMSIIAEVSRSLFMVFYYILKSWVEFFYVKRKDLKGEVVLITGAAGGIGSRLSKRLAQKGCKLILVDINEEVKRLATEINQSAEKSVNSSYGDCKNGSLATDCQDDVSLTTSCQDDGNLATGFICDISSEDEVAQLYTQITHQPTMIINNAGTLAGKYFHDISLNEIHHTFKVNTLSHYTIVKQFLPRMLEMDHGHIVSISSILALTPSGGLSDYAASKAAATALMRALRQEIRFLGKHVVCTNVLPFQINTQLFKGCESRFPNFPFMSVLDPDYVTEKIIEAIEKNKVAVYIPRVLYIMAFMYQVLPSKVFDVIYDFFLVNYAMKTHVGHGKTK